MTPAERALEITSVLAQDRLIKQLIISKPLAMEIPQNKQLESFFLMINFCIDLSTLSLSSLWNLTVPVMDRLYRSGMLKEFNGIGTQISAVVEKKHFDRILRVESTISDFPRIPLIRKEDLLQETDWNGRYQCHWYWKKENIPY